MWSEHRRPLFAGLNAVPIRRVWSLHLKAYTIYHLEWENGIHLRSPTFFPLIQNIEANLPEINIHSTIEKNRAIFRTYCPHRPP